MSTVLGRILGESIQQLHPRVARRWDVEPGYVRYGEGVMTSIAHSRLMPWPVLKYGARHRMFCDRSGVDVPFTLANYAYVNDGKLALGFERRFLFPGATVSVDSVMLAEGDHGVDLIGDSGQIRTMTYCKPRDGNLVLTSLTPSMKIGLLPVPQPPSRTHTVDGFDEASGRNTISVRVAATGIGDLFSYEGWFTVSEPVRAEAPASLRGIR